VDADHVRHRETSPTVCYATGLLCHAYGVHRVFDKPLPRFEITLSHLTTLASGCSTLTP